MTHDSTAMIDVLLPTYSPNPDHLRQAIESVLSQTEKDWRMVIHDDPSDANVEATVRPYLSDERMTFKQSTERLSISGNWNACLKYATAPYVQYLFQDDWWEPQYLKRALEVLESNPTAVLVSVDHSYTFEGNIATRHAYEELQSLKRTHVAPGLHRGAEFLRWWFNRGLHPNVIGEPSFVMIRRDAFGALRPVRYTQGRPEALEGRRAQGDAGSFCEDMPQFLDVDMWLRLLERGDVYFLKDILGTFRVHPAGASMQNEESGAGISDRLRCFERLIERLHGDDRAAAIRARNKAVQGMVERYFERRRKGMNVPSTSKRELKKFVLRHPLVIGAAIVKTLASRRLTKLTKRAHCKPPPLPYSSS